MNFQELCYLATNDLNRVARKGDPFGFVRRIHDRHLEEDVEWAEPCQGG